MNRNGKPGYGQTVDRIEISKGILWQSRGRYWCNDLIAAVADKKRVPIRLCPRDGGDANCAPRSTDIFDYDRAEQGSRLVSPGSANRVINSARWERNYEADRARGIGLRCHSA